MHANSSMRHALALVLALALAFPATAQTRPRNMDQDAFVAANLIAIFYHELGHALIDVMELPIFGQEEDAADVLSILMVHEIFEEQSAVDIAYATAMGLAREAEIRTTLGEETVWWGVHGADMQRYYTLVCLFYGAAPDRRRPFAAELGLPDARAETCPEEYELAQRAWGPVLDELYAAGPGETLRFRTVGRMGREARLPAAIIREEVNALNAVMSLPVRIWVDVARCGEPNAFYDPSTREIIMCTEFASYLAEIAS